MAERQIPDGRSDGRPDRSDLRVAEIVDAQYLYLGTYGISF